MTSKARAVAAEFLLLVLMAFGPLAFGGVEAWSLSLLQIAIFSLFALAVGLPVSSTMGPAHTALLPAALFLVVLGVLQVLNPLSPDGILPMWVPFTTAAHSTYDQILSLCAYGALIFSVPRVLRDDDSAVRFAWSLFLLGVFISVVGIMQMSAGNTHYYGLREISLYRVPFGPYPNSNHAANLMVMSAFMGLGLTISRIPRKNPQGFGNTADLLASVGLILFLMGVLLAGIFKAHARASWLSLFFSAICLSFLGMGFLRHRWNRALARGLLIIIGIAAAAVIFANSPQVRDALDSASHSHSMRVSMYKSGWAMVRDYPVFGFGLGSLAGVFSAYQDWGHITYFVDHVHCDGLELLIETGLVGFLVLTSALSYMLFQSIRHWTRLRHGTRRCVTTGAIGAVVSFLLHSLLDFPSHIPGNAVVFIILLSWLGAASSGFDKEDTVPRYRRGLVPMLYGACLLLGIAALRPAVASHYERASRTSSRAAQPFYLTKAWTWNRKPEYQHQLGWVYLKLANENPLAQFALLDIAISHCDIALRMDPLNDRYAYLKGVILHRMGRRQDAQAFLIRRPIEASAPPLRK